MICSWSLKMRVQSHWPPYCFSKLTFILRSLYLLYLHERNSFPLGDYFSHLLPAGSLLHTVQMSPSSETPILIITSILSLFTPLLILFSLGTPKQGALGTTAYSSRLGPMDTVWLKSCTLGHHQGYSSAWASPRPHIQCPGSHLGPGFKSNSDTWKACNLPPTQCPWPFFSIFITLAFI